MDELIAQLEKATGPDRQLDRLIEETMPGVLRHDDYRMVKDGYVISGPDHPRYPFSGQAYLPPEYTGSFDAAAQLAPNGAEWSVEKRAGKGFAPAYAALWAVGAKAFDFHGNGDGRTPAIAFCIAALRYRRSLSSVQETGEG